MEQFYKFSTAHFNRDCCVVRLVCTGPSKGRLDTPSLFEVILERITSHENMWSGVNGMPKI